eukprot:scaffold63146_cov30-Phaeocystis_antarctica.AAC.1
MSSQLEVVRSSKWPQRLGKEHFLPSSRTSSSLLLSTYYAPPRARSAPGRARRASPPARRAPRAAPPPASELARRPHAPAVFGNSGDTTCYLLFATCYRRLRSSATAVRRSLLTSSSKTVFSST